ncbi:MAG: hypothetical protein J2P18_00135 [Nocardia sp.]|nr:hypothetical protein [Nocardia sp.]
MNEYTPQRVGVYELVDVDYVRMAEFQLTPRDTVDLVLLEPGCCPLAQRWYADGIRMPGNIVRVTPDDGTAFMHALLLQRPMSYCRVVDESTAVLPQSQ